MDSAPYDILRRQDNAAIWLETSPDLDTAKSRIKKIESFWPGEYEVVDHQSQRIVATISTSTWLRNSFRRMRGGATKSFYTTYEWLLAPAPCIAGLATYTRMQKYARSRYRASCDWLWAPVARVQVNRPR
jgi:hypothetical protein